FMGGIIGRLFREFAITLSIAIAVSAVLSLTLTAMMCAHLLKPHGEERESRMARAFEAGFASMLRVYERGLKWVLAHQPLTLAVTIGTLLLTALLAAVVPKGFFPLQDTGLIVGVSEAPADVSFLRMSDRQRAVDEVILSGPADARPDAAATAARRRRQRRGVGRLAAAPRHRPRHGLAPGHLAASGRRRALRRVRPAAGVDHLHAAQSIPRHPRNGPGRRAERHRSRSDLRALAERRAGAALGVRARHQHADR